MTRHIACIFAHPDDETFCVGGTLAKYAADGVDISLFCATNGDAGKSAAVPVSSREELAALRKQETMAAASILGIGAVEFGGYGDGTLGDIEPTPLIGDIVRFIRRRRPTIILGFGPEGAPTGHRDHRAMSHATMAAFFLSGIASAHREKDDAGDEPFRADRLFFHSWDFPLADPRLRVEPVAPTAGIDVRAFRDRKREAFLAHRTQQLSLPAFESVQADFEHLAFAIGIPQPAAMIDDLFAGL